MTARWAIGIDLGTTNTALAFRPLDGDAPVEVFGIPQLVRAAAVEPRPLLPSFLYLPHPAELPPGATALPWGAGDGIVGEWARALGAQTPVRLVSSAKSWLSHPTLDRRAASLPAGSPGGTLRRMTAFTGDVLRKSPASHAKMHAKKIGGVGARKHAIANGAAHALDPATLSELPAPFPSGRKVLTGTLPGVAPGAVVEVEITVRDRAPASDAGGVLRIPLAGPDPVRRLHRVHLVRRHRAVHLAHDPAPAVERQQRRGVLAIDAQPLAHHVVLVVVALDERGAAPVARRGGGPPCAALANLHPPAPTERIHTSPACEEYHPLTCAMTPDGEGSVPSLCPRSRRVMSCISASLTIA